MLSVGARLLLRAVSDVAANDRSITGVKLHPADDHGLASSIRVEVEGDFALEPIGTLYRQAGFDVHELPAARGCRDMLRIFRGEARITCPLCGSGEGRTACRFCGGFDPTFNSTDEVELDA